LQCAIFDNEYTHTKRYSASFLLTTLTIDY